MADLLAVPAHTFPQRSPSQLLGLAWATLDEAARPAAAGLRHARAHLAALRGAAALVASRARPVVGDRSPLAGVWVLLGQVAPEFDAWAEHFTVLPTGQVTDRRADDMVESARSFLVDVGEWVPVESAAGGEFRG